MTSWKFDWVDEDIYRRNMLDSNKVICSKMKMMEVKRGGYRYSARRRGHGRSPGEEHTDAAVSSGLRLSH